MKKKYLYATTEEDIAKANAKYPLANVSRKFLIIILLFSAFTFAMAIWAMLDVLRGTN